MIISNRNYFSKDRRQSSILREVRKEDSDSRMKYSKSRRIEFVKGLTEMNVKTRFKASQALKHDWLNYKE